MNTCWFQTNHTKMVVISDFAILNIEIITFNSGPTTTAEQQTTTDETTMTDTTTHETTTTDTTTDETTTRETNDGSKDNLITIIIGPILVVCVLIGIIIVVIMVLLKIRGNKRDYVNTTKQANSIKTLEPIVNKSDTPVNMVMQHSNHRIMQLINLIILDLYICKTTIMLIMIESKTLVTLKMCLCQTNIMLIMIEGIIMVTLNMNLCQMNRLLIMIERMIMIVMCN